MRATTIGGVGAVAIGGAVVTGLWMLFERTQRPTLEVKSYVHSVHEAAERWASNTEDLMGELQRMPDLTATVAALTAGYVDALEQS